MFVWTFAKLKTYPLMAWSVQEMG